MITDNIGIFGESERVESVVYSGIKATVVFLKL